MSGSFGLGHGELGDILGAMDEQENPLNRSYNSAISNSSANNASASSSKAVLAALRALQDKIRRLETERAQALDECAQLRHQMKQQEIETEHLRQRESLAAQKALHESRSAYEKVLTEKTETEVRLAKIEDRNKEEQRLAEESRHKMRQVEEEKHTGLLNIKDLEAEKAQLQSQITHFQQKEKELGQTILWETKRHEEDMDVLGTKLRTLQGELSSCTQDKAIVETKLLELDQLVGQLLSVNESLVTRLSGKPMTTTSTTKGKKGTKKTASKPPFVPRAASVSTVSFDHSRKAASGIPTKTSMARTLEEAESLQQMHLMYVDLARSISAPTSVSSTRKVRRSSSASTSTPTPTHAPTLASASVPLLMSGAGAGAGALSGSVTGRPVKQNTMVRGRRDEFGDYVVDGRDDYPGMYPQGNLITPNGGINVRVPSVSFDVTSMYGGGSGGGSGGGGYDDSTQRTSQSFLHSGGIANGSGSGSGSGPKNRPMSDIQSVISSLEEEFAVLNGQYRHLLASVQTQSPSVDIGQAEDLVTIIQKLHKKGEQLRALRAPTPTR